MFAITITNGYIHSSLTKENMSFPSTSSGVSLLHYCTKMFLIKKQNKTKQKHTTFQSRIQHAWCLAIQVNFQLHEVSFKFAGAPSGQKKKKKMTNPLPLHLTLIPFWIRLAPLKKNKQKNKKKKQNKTKTKIKTKLDLKQIWTQSHVTSVFCEIRPFFDLCLLNHSFSCSCDQIWQP